ncbi:hypothetical protein ABPG75_013605 [Micractinium tetrahymenae]
MSSEEKRGAEHEKSYKLHAPSETDMFRAVEVEEAPARPAEGAGGKSFKLHAPSGTDIFQAVEVEDLPKRPGTAPAGGS